MFEALMASIILWLATFNTPYVSHEDWRIEKPWEKQDDFYVFRASSTAILDECRKDPTFLLELPHVLGLPHRVEVDGFVIKGNSSENTRYFNFFYNASWISCKDILVGNHRVFWQIKSPSLLMSPIKQYPVLVKQRPWYAFVNQTVFIGSSFSLLLLSLFSLLVFLGKIDIKTVAALALSGPFFFFYMASIDSEKFHIYWHYLISHRIGHICLGLGFSLLFYCYRKREFLNIHLFRAFITAAIGNAIIVSISSNFDSVVVASLCQSPFLFACIANINYRFFSYNLKTKRLSTYLQALCLLAFDLMILNDAYMTIRGSILLLFGIGVSCGYAFLFLAINEDIMQTYRDRADLFEKLHAGQEKLFALQTKESIYQSIVSTSQMVAHDIRRPFSFIMGLLSLAKKAESPEQIKNLFAKYGEAIDDSIQSVQGMIDDILSFGSKHNLNFEPISLSEILYYSSNQIKAWKDITNIKFHFDLQHHYKINADSHHTRRVIENIVSNAVKAMMGVGNIVYSSASSTDAAGKNFVTLTIHNDGALIPDHFLDSIMEPFVTGDTRTGRGLGLAICHKIVSEHGGHLSCLSTAEKGTSFTITLPALSDEDDFPKHMLQAMTVSPMTRERGESLGSLTPEAFVQKLATFLQRGRRLRILALDDEGVYLSLVEGYLASHPGVRDKIDLVLLDEPGPVIDSDYVFGFSLVILDVEMNAQLNGYELLTRWRQKGYKGKVCIHSNWGGFESAELARKAEADLYIPKPISQEQLWRIIADVVDDLMKGKN